MPDHSRKPKDHTFEIEVNEGGRFSYIPNKPWMFFPDDNIEIKSNKGPFWVRYVTVGHPKGEGIPSKPANDKPLSPFGGAKMTLKGETKESDGYTTGKIPITPYRGNESSIDQFREDNEGEYGSKYISNFGYYFYVDDEEMEGPQTDLSHEGMWC